MNTIRLLTSELPVGTAHKMAMLALCSHFPLMFVPQQSLTFEKQFNGDSLHLVLSSFQFLLNPMH